MKNRRTIWGLVALLALVGVLLVFFVLRMTQNGVQEEKMKVSVLKTGKSDAIVIQSEGSAMMIDTGEVDDAEKIVQFLKAEGITTLKAMIITHFDKDHVGGAGLIMENFNVERLLIPNYEGTIVEYADFMRAIEAALLTPERVSEQMEFTMGAASICIEPPLNYDVNVIADVVEDYDNTLSLMTEITCGEKKFLFTADADKRRLNEWLESHRGDHYDFLKVPHHGKFNAALETLLQETTPQYAAMTCSKKNPADDSVVTLLRNYGVEVYQTRDGAITLLTDGNAIKVLQD